MIFSDATLSTEDWWTKKLPRYKINKPIFSTSSQGSRQIEKTILISICHFLFFVSFSITSSLDLE